MGSWAATACNFQCRQQRGSGEPGWPVIVCGVYDFRGIRNSRGCHVLFTDRDRECQGWNADLCLSVLIPFFRSRKHTEQWKKKNHYHGNKDRWPKFTYVCLVKRRHSFLTSIFHKLIFFFLGTTYVFTTNPFKNTRNTLLKEQHFCELLQIYIKKIHIKRVWLFMLKLLFYKTKKQSWLWMAEDVSIHIWKIMFILLNFEDVSSLALAKQAYLACHWYLTIPLTKFWYNHWENLSK